MSKILAVKTNILFPDGVWEGFREQKSEAVLNLIDEHKEFVERASAEEDESYQQIIPQIILKVGNKIFLHKIPQTGSEGRLHDMWPIFLGGHVDDTDSSIWDAAEREFNEEINYRGKIIKKEFLGIVKRNDMPVNKVHTGLVWLFEGDIEEFEATADHGIADGRFVQVSDLDSYVEKMTHWSQVVASYIIRRFASR